MNHLEGVSLVMSNENMSEKGEEIKVPLMEADLKREWGTIENLIPKEVAPQVDPNDDDLTDLFAWGKWVAKKANILQSDSKKMLGLLRRRERE